MGHKVCSENVDVELISFNVGILFGNGGKTLVPERHGEKNAIGLGGRGDVAFSGPGKLECVGNHAVATAPRKHALLDSHLEIAIAIQSASSFRILAFCIFPDDNKVDVSRISAAEWTFNSLQQSSGAAADVLLKAAPDRDQQPPQRNVISHSWIANSA